MPSTRRVGVTTSKEPDARTSTRPTCIPAVLSGSGHTARTRSPVRNPRTRLRSLSLAPDEAALIHQTHLPTLSPFGLDLPGDDVLPVQCLGGGGTNTAGIHPMRLGHAMSGPVP